MHGIIIHIRTNPRRQWDLSTTGSLWFTRKGVTIVIDRDHTVMDGPGGLPKWEYSHSGETIDSGSGIEAGSPHGQVLLELFPNFFEVRPVSTCPPDLDPYDGVPADTGSV